MLSSVVPKETTTTSQPIRITIQSKNPTHNLWWTLILASFINILVSISIRTQQYIRWNSHSISFMSFGRWFHLYVRWLYIYRVVYVDWLGLKIYTSFCHMKAKEIHLWQQWDTATESQPTLNIRQKSKFDNLSSWAAARLFTTAHAFKQFTRNIDFQKVERFTFIMEMT